MVYEEQVRGSLESVLVPGVKRSIVGLNMVRTVSISDGKVKVRLASTALNVGTRDWVKEKAQEVLKRLPWIEGVEVNFTEAKPKDLNEISHIIAVMSGKGGVGKSLVASLIAVGLKRRGLEIGILDADITGSSIPKMFGIRAQPIGSDNGILPVLARSGIELMSLNLLLPNEDDAVIWRGPLIGGAITQFWEEVLWGKLDYLVVDLPPGTADAPLTVMQKLPISGVIIVSTPQDLVEMIVKKAMKMAHKMEKRVLGVIENMSYLYIPEIDRKIEIFGKSQADQMTIAAKAPLLGQLPIDPELAKICDNGDIERYSSDIVAKMTEALITSMPS